MCTGYEPYLIMAAATGAQAVNQNQSLRRKDRQAAAGIRKQSGLRREAAQDINKRVSELGQSGPQDAARERMGEYMTALRRSRGDSEGSLGNVPGASSRFAQDSDEARASMAGEAQTTAGRMSRMDAPVMQRQEEGFATGDLARNLGQIGLRSNAQDYLTQLRVNDERPNDWVSAAAQAAQAYAGARAGKAGSSGSPNTFTVPGRNASTDPFNRYTIYGEP